MVQILATLSFSFTLLFFFRPWFGTTVAFALTMVLALALGGDAGSLADIVSDPVAWTSTAGVPFAVALKSLAIGIVCALSVSVACISVAIVGDWIGSHALPGINASRAELAQGDAAHRYLLTGVFQVWLILLIFKMQGLDDLIVMLHSSIGTLSQNLVEPMNLTLLMPWFGELGGIAFSSAARLGLPLFGVAFVFDIFCALAACLDAKLATNVRYPMYKLPVLVMALLVVVGSAPSILRYHLVDSFKNQDARKGPQLIGGQHE